jgi:hypothetical protein
MKTGVARIKALLAWMQILGWMDKIRDLSEVGGEPRAGPKILVGPPS